MKKLLMVPIVVLIATTDAPAGQAAAAEQEVRQTILALTASYKDDLPKYFSYFDPSAPMLWSMRGRVTVKEYQDMTKTRKPYESTGVDDLQIVVDPTGDAAAASYILSTKNPGAEPQLYQMSPVLFRRGGKWQIVYLHVSQLQRPSRP